MAKGEGHVRNVIGQTKHRKNMSVVLLTVIVTPETDRPLFRQMQDESFARMSAMENIEVRGDNIYTKRLYYGEEEKQNIVIHSYDNEELEAAEKLYKYLPKLQNGKYDPLNESRHNIKKKKKDGIKFFVKYDVNIDGKTFELKTAAKQNKGEHGYITEHPYSLKKKKEK